MPEVGTNDFQSIQDSLVVVYIDGKKCYGKRPGGLPCPVTNQPVEFEEIFDENGNRIDGFRFAVPLIESSDTGNYETIGPEDIDTKNV